ncbi:MAG: futalosine hydrolase [Frankiaceae bacterium]|nr:futalosine hydrolase [Frankiaceae bacterium]
MVAVPKELDALVAGRGGQPVAFGPMGGVAMGTPAGEVVVVAGGVGVAACAAATATILAREQFDLVVSAGIAGGFGAPIGSIVVAARSLAADLGCQTDEAFLSLSEMGLGIDAYDVPRDWADELLARAGKTGLMVCLGDIGTVSTITGTAAGEREHRLRNGAAAEAMEGFGVATAAALAGVPFVEVRAVSNTVGPRNVATWRTADALAAIGTVLTAVFAERWPW